MNAIKQPHASHETEERCSAHTSAGARCKKKPAGASKICTQHQQIVASGGATGAERRQEQLRQARKRYRDSLKGKKKTEAYKKSRRKLSAKGLVIMNRRYHYDRTVQAEKARNISVGTKVILYDYGISTTGFGCANDKQYTTKNMYEHPATIVQEHVETLGKYEVRLLDSEETVLVNCENVFRCDKKLSNGYETYRLVKYGRYDGPGNFDDAWLAWRDVHLPRHGQRDDNNAFDSDYSDKMEMGPAYLDEETKVSTSFYRGSLLNKRKCSRTAANGNPRLKWRKIKFSDSDFDDELSDEPPRKKPKRSNSCKIFSCTDLKKEPRLQRSSSWTYKNDNDDHDTIMKDNV